MTDPLTGRRYKATAANAPPASRAAIHPTPAHPLKVFLDIAGVLCSCYVHVRRRHRPGRSRPTRSQSGRAASHRPGPQPRSHAHRLRQESCGHAAPARGWPARPPLLHLPRHNLRLHRSRADPRPHHPRSAPRRRARSQAQPACRPRPGPEAYGHPPAVPTQAGRRQAGRPRRAARPRIRASPVSPRPRKSSPRTAAARSAPSSSISASIWASCLGRWIVRRGTNCAAISSSTVAISPLSCSRANASGALPFSPAAPVPAAVPASAPFPLPGSAPSCFPPGRYRRGNPQLPPAPAHRSAPPLPLRLPLSHNPKSTFLSAEQRI